MVVNITFKTLALYHSELFCECLSLLFPLFHTTLSYTQLAKSLKNVVYLRLVARSESLYTTGAIIFYYNPRKGKEKKQRKQDFSQLTSTSSLLSRVWRFLSPQTMTHIALLHIPMNYGICSGKTKAVLTTWRRSRFANKVNKSASPSCAPSLNVVQCKHVDLKSVLEAARAYCCAHRGGVFDVLEELFASAVKSGCLKPAVRF